MAQWGKRPIADFSSGHDLVVHGFEPRIGLCADIAKPVWDFFLSLSLSLPACSLFLSQQINIKKLKENNNNSMLVGFPFRKVAVCV